MYFRGILYNTIISDKYLEGNIGSFVELKDITKDEKRELLFGGVVKLLNK